MAKLLSGTRVYGTATVDAQLIVAGTATSTSTVTGALLVSGGVGIRGDLWVGGTINGSLNTVANTATSVQTAARATNANHFLTFVDANNPTATAELIYTTSSVVVNPGTGEVDILSNLASTSTTTGALVVFGGVGIGGNLNIRGVTSITNTTSATSTITGALQVAGGVGIRGDLWVGGIINGTIAGAGSAGTANTSTQILTASTNTTTSHFLTFVDANNATATAENLVTTSTIQVVPRTGEVDILSTLSSISTTTGALVVTGGVGVGTNLNVGGSVRLFNNNTSSIRIFSETLDSVNGVTFEGTQGRLLSITDTFTGTIFSVARNDGIPSIEVYDTGTVLLNEYGGWVEVLSTAQATSTTTGAIRVIGGVGIRGNLWVGGTINGNIAGASNTATHIAGGSTGTIFYQSAPGTTAALSIATTAGWQLVSNGVIPVWTASSGGTAITINNDTASTTTHFLAFVSTSTGTVSILKTAATTGMVYVPSSGNFGIGTISAPIYKLEVNGSFAATTKSFLINHPTKQGWRLRYGSLEGAENGVYARGRLTGINIIELPEYWTKLIDPNSITVNITPIGRDQNLFVKEIQGNTIVIGNSNLFNKDIDCYYTVFAERNDVEKLVSEIPPDLNG